MKPTSHTSKRHSHRRPLAGLTPDSIVREMQEAASAPKKVRKLRGGSLRPDGEVLSDPREGVSGEAGSVGIFGESSGTGGKGPPVSNDQGISEPRGTQISRVLKRMLGEQPPAALMQSEGIGRAATNAEMLGAIIWKEALAGRQWAIEMVRDQTEGKPIRAAQVNNSEAEVEDQLDRVTTSTLNRLAKKES